MTTTDERVEFEEELLVMLHEAAVQRQTTTPRRRPRATKLVALIAAVVAATVAVSALSISAIGHGEYVVVNSAHALHDPSAVIAQLRSAGIDAQIIQVPIDPTAEGRGRVGKWNNVTFARANAISSADFTALREPTGTSTGSDVRLPKGISGLVRLYVNRAARPGETPWFFGDDLGVNELGPTGTFWCLALEDRTPQAATSELQALGYEVQWLRVTPNYAMFPIDHIPPSSKVVFSFVHGPGVVDLRMADARHADSLRAAFGTPSLQYPRSTWSSWAPSC